MDQMIVELVLWTGFGLLIWAMYDSLTRLEAALDSRPQRHPGLGRVPASVPERLSEPIGEYRGQPIHDFALIEGRHYRFAHVWPHAPSAELDERQRWVAPGLVYFEYSPPADDQGPRRLSSAR